MPGRQGLVFCPPKSPPDQPLEILNDHRRQRPADRPAHVAHFTAAVYSRLSVRNEGCVVAAQEAPPSPVFLRNGHGRSATVPVPPSGVDGLGERWIETLEPLHSRSEDENDPSMIIDDVATAGKPAGTSARKLTFLKKERWKAIPKARRKGMSLRSIEREMGIHRGTIKQYLDAEGPPTRQCRVVSSTSSSDTIEA